MGAFAQTVSLHRAKVASLMLKFEIKASRTSTREWVTIKQGWEESLKTFLIVEVVWGMEMSQSGEEKETVFAKQNNNIYIFLF